MNVKNSSGKILYGMHFYPGLAQYNHANNDSYKIFLNEDTLRKMDASFSGKPIFVEHVDEVHSDINELRKEADGWVVESFFNSVDGKHWVKMVIVSDRAERAIKNGFRLSNAYVPRLNGRAGQWNGIDYQNEVIDGEYEHLAIVKNPRYEESVIMTPEEYKLYNEGLSMELKRISNSDFKESDHPRAEDGKFGSGGGSSGSSRPSSREKKTKEAVVDLVSRLTKEKDFPPAHKEKIKSVLSLFKEGKVDAKEVSFRLKQAGYHETANIISPKESVENNLNYKKKESSIMKLKFWNRKPVESSIDYENISVTLPKSGKEYTIYQIVNAMDKMEEEKELKNKKMKNKESEKDDYEDEDEEDDKKENREEETETGIEMKKKSVDVEGDLHNEDEEESSEEEENKKEMKKNKKMKNKEKEDCYENEDEEEDKKMKNKKMKNELAAKRKSNFDSLKNAPFDHLENSTLKNDNNLFDKTSLGKSRYGSN